MALEGTYKVPGIGPVNKKGAVYGTLAIVVVGGGIYLMRRRSGAGTAAAASSATTGTGQVTDPAGNTCSAVNPATGFCPGTPEDVAAGGYNTSQLGTGGLAGYYYGPGGAVPQSPPGPGNFADNAEWSQYAINYTTQTLNANARPLGDALGLYLAGQSVTSSQRTLIEEAIAIAGRPPQAGTGGYPPNIRLETTHKPKPKPDKDKVTVPRVTGDRYEEAAADLVAADLTPEAAGRLPFREYIVTAQNPRAGAKVNPETRVHLTIREKAGAGK